MPNTTKKDYTQYSQKQLFNLINQLEQKISQAFDDKRGCCFWGMRSQTLKRNKP
ncbi:hypothetical protein HPHPA8_0813 [Helicobacter pylori Hp A-8]|nr:hypothetical protein HPHPA8_0813 [Helicobacter pylori Hp A-8]